MQFEATLDSLTIQNFKAFSDVKLEGFGAFNLFIGANDAGKTSMLEALFLLTGCSNLGLPITIQNNRGVIVQSFQDLSYFFHGLNVREPVTMVAESKGLGETRELEMRAKGLANRSIANGQKGVVSDGGRISDAYPASSDGLGLSSSISGPFVLEYDAKLHHLGRSEPSRYRAQLRVESRDDIKFDEVEKSSDDVDMTLSARFISAGNNYFAKAISDVVVHKKDKELLKLLEGLNPQITGIASRADMAFVDTGLDRMIPLNMFGSGIVRATNLLSLSILAESKILLIDEVENGLHYEGVVPLLRSLIGLSVAKNIQIFATTQSLAILQGIAHILNEKAFEEARPLVKCYSLVKDKSGTVRSYEYDHAQFEHCISKGIEIR